MMAKSNETISPVFIDGSALKIPTFSILKANGHLIKGAQSPMLEQELAYKIYRRHGLHSHA